HPVRQGPHPWQHHPSRHRGHAAAGPVPDRGHPKGVRDRHSARAHRGAARDRRRRPVSGQRRVVVHDRRRAGRGRRLHRRLTRVPDATRSIAARPFGAARRHDVTTVAVAGAVLLALLIFVVWPVVKVLGLSLTGPAGLTLANYAAFFSTWRLFRILVNSLLVS